MLVERGLGRGRRSPHLRNDTSGWRVWRQGSIALIHSDPQAHTARRARRPRRRSMTALALLHCRELFRRGSALIFRLPGLVGHAVDGLAALALGQDGTFGIGL